MLVRFTVGNFLSFDEHQSLPLVVSTSARLKERAYSVCGISLLKFAAIFGANAAGKSNVIKAMAFAHTVFKQGVNASTGSDLYCRLDPRNKEKPSYFEFEIVVGDKLYAYGFEILLAKRVITEEWLVALDKEFETILFSRDTQRQTYAGNKEFFSYLEAEKGVEDSLLLQHSALPGILSEVQAWFNRLTLATATSSLSGYSAFPIEDWGQLKKAISLYATGISDIQFSEVDESVVSDNVLPSDKKQFAQDKEKARTKEVAFRLQIGNRLFFMQMRQEKLAFFEVGFAHQGTHFNYDEESEGTRRLLDLLSLLVAATEGSVAVIDEIDRSLHPKLTLQFVKNYLELAKTRNLQLIITTHESLLLNLNLLWRDEIFFVEKNREGSSVIYPFDQFQEQFDDQVEQAYLDGRYGGVPFFGGFYLGGEDDV